MASSLVVPRNNGKLRHLFLGPQNSRCTRVCSLHMVRFLWQRLSTEGTQAGRPKASVSLPVLASISASNALMTPPSSSSTSSRAESNCSHSGLSGWVPNKAGHCAKADSSKFISLSCCCTKNRSAPSGHASPSGQPLGRSRLGLCYWCHSQGVQMSDSLLGPFVSELSCHLHFMSGFLESPLVGCDICHVASPGVYAHQLVGVAK